MTLRRKTLAWEYCCQLNAIILSFKCIFSQRVWNNSWISIHTFLCKFCDTALKSCMKTPKHKTKKILKTNYDGNIWPNVACCSVHKLFLQYKIFSRKQVTVWWRVRPIPKKDFRQKIVGSTTAAQMFLKQQISILEWFLKDHVTLKSNDAENSAMHHNNILRFKIYSNRKQLIEMIIMFHNNSF